jgi:gamma-glutamylcyclotransferase (GGCT)/AIG2-like uncharacterized protein YtfP
MAKIFVYGTLMYGNRLHGVLQEHDAKYVGLAYTEEKHFKLYSTGSFPVLLYGGTASVRGEVYELNLKGFRHIDNIETGYTRKQIKVINASLEQSYHSLDAWTYIGDIATWRSLIPQMEVCPLYANPIKHYAFR